MDSTEGGKRSAGISQIDRLERCDGRPILVDTDDRIAHVASILA